MFPRAPHSGEGEEKEVRLATPRNENEGGAVATSDAAFSSFDDTCLAVRLLSGCQDALTILFERHSGLVFRIARRMLRDDGEAEETVQQVFLDVYRSIAQFDPAKGSFRSWLLQFAYHRTINRREHLQARRFYDWRQLDDMLPAELAEGASRPFQLSSQEIARLAEELLASLETRQRRILELTFYDGMTADEIAKGSGETASAVRHTLYRGLKKLRSALFAGVQERNISAAEARAQKEGVYIATPRTL
jgi:RNA polymerase sigma-70 factor, ECF subfamily